MMLVLLFVGSVLLCAVLLGLSLMRLGVDGDHWPRRRM